MNLQKTTTAACVMFFCQAALAGNSFMLDGGWQATILDGGDVDLAVDYWDPGAGLLVLEKYANFYEIDDVTGTPSPVRILFEQIEPDALTASTIAITDELVLNNTGMDWTDFHMALLGTNAIWDGDASAGFSHDPFANMTFSTDFSTVNFDGGTVFAGDSWTPGIDSGALFIDIDLSGNEYVSFVLKEFPTIPAPGAAVLLCLAGLLTAPRRRA